MKLTKTWLLLIIFFLFCGQAVLGDNLTFETALASDDSSLSLDEIMNRVEKHYAVSGFSTDFYQTSTIKAMEITDSASGKAFFKRPGKMRWEYETPDRQMIITDSHTLWVFRPEDNQVMIGKAPSFFKDGKGFSFLTDMKVIKEKFSINLEKETKTDFFTLKLLPNEKTYDLAEIYLWISKKTFDVVRIITYNSYGDETRIVFDNIQFKQKLDDGMFEFKIPKGIEVLTLDEQ